MSSEKPRPKIYNRDSRLSSILSGIDTLTDIDTGAADQYRQVAREHSITSFLEKKAPVSTDDYLHDCRSPLEHVSTEEKGLVLETVEQPFRASIQQQQQQQNKAQVRPTPRSPVLVSASIAPHHQRRDTVASGTVLRRLSSLDSPPPSPNSEWMTMTRSMSFLI